MNRPDQERDFERGDTAYPPSFLMKFMLAFFALGFAATILSRDWSGVAYSTIGMVLCYSYFLRIRKPIVRVTSSKLIIYGGVLRHRTIPWVTVRDIFEKPWCVELLCEGRRRVVIQRHWFRWGEFEDFLALIRGNVAHGA